MKYPLPAYAATIWYNGHNYTLILPAPHGGERRFTFDDLRQAEEHLRTLHAEVATEREARLCNKHGGPAILTSPHARVEFDMLGGRYHQLSRPMSDAKREELRRIADDIITKTVHKAKPKGKAKTMTLEDLGL